MEPDAGVEPATCRLQSGCSATIELPQRWKQPPGTWVPTHRGLRQCWRSQYTQGDQPLSRPKAISYIHRPGPAINPGSLITSTAGRIAPCHLCVLQAGRYSGWRRHEFGPLPPWTLKAACLLSTPLQHLEHSVGESAGQRKSGAPGDAAFCWSHIGKRVPARGSPMQHATIGLAIYVRFFCASQPQSLSAARDGTG